MGANSQSLPILTKISLSKVLWLLMLHTLPTASAEDLLEKNKTWATMKSA